MKNVYFTEAIWELRTTFRQVGYWIPVVLFPSLIFLLYGVVAQHSGSISPHEIFHAFSAMVVFDSMSTGLFTVGVLVASDREIGLLRLKRLYPMPPGTYMISKILASMVLISLALLLLIVLFLISGGGYSLKAFAETGFFAVAGVVPFSAIGLVIGLYAGMPAASGIANLVLLFLGFVSGVFITMQSLPVFLQKISIIWPSHQLYDLCYGAISGTMRGSMWLHIVVLFLETLLFALIALYKWRKTA